MATKQKVKQNQPAPLMCWDICSSRLNKLLNIPFTIEDLNTLNKFRERFHWMEDLGKLLADKSFEAIILTDIKQKIIWVNDGFETMTGYPKAFAINKTLSFLQGKETSPEVRDKIRANLQKLVPFRETIINYRKDNSLYKCELNIFPLKGENSIHFLSLEREVA
jgi:PAS domain S-box-containing protein